MFKQINQYSPKAYRADQAANLAISQPTRFAQPLQKSARLTKAIPEKWLNQEILEECQQLDKQLLTESVDEEEYRTSEMRFDSEVLRLPSFGRFGLLQQLLTLFWGVGKVGTYAFPPLSIFAALGWGATAYSAGDPFWNHFLESLFITNTMMTLPCFIAFQGVPLFEKYLGPKIYGDMKTEYEFNRVTGRVKIFDDKSGELLHDFPFSECVAETWAQAGHQGVVVKNTLNIRHYQDPKACIEGGRIGDEYRLADTYATWNFIQCYMDTGQPLPDIPALEMWRQSDPASIASDAQSGRNPRYWRDMSMDEAEQVFAAQSLLNYQLA
ncbi:hypothetical protein [Motilimonas sp. E26]|uniref:hypothetical protein n=1 Tax=Motilimonas sp. E26 TaxID=2865674 RepID=UPI001E5166CD|nr:hypothetical protein [Motilimonas sp. E26]MCE0555892.1 hypothetical protein [Motilimonas sp. E26]